VLAIDMPGRGQSDWLADPNDYVFTTYLTTLVALIARSGAETVDWIGTSMGGLLGIRCRRASRRARSRGSS
jgi:pimeloyl-ACP methyl ester carboxylesterase